MSDMSRSFHFAKQTKFANCVVRTVHIVMMWQGQMMSWQAEWAGDLAWYMDQSGVDTCLLGGKWYGVTWPSRGLPRGTPPMY
jgi:hypothetical protein